MVAEAPVLACDMISSDSMMYNVIESFKAFFFPAQTSKNSNSELPSERVKMGEMAHGYCKNTHSPQ
jgi:hypothetical protein